MPPKILRWYASLWDRACVLACLYGCELTLEQFCASHGLESEEKDLLLDYFLHCGSLTL